MRFFTCFILIACVCGRAVAGEQLVLAADEWCPFNCSAGDLERPGYMIELARRALTEHAIEVTYVNMPWARAKVSVSEGLVHGLVAATKDDPDTRHLIFPALSQGVAYNVFFGHGDVRWQFQGLASLRNIRLGAVKDYGYGPLLDNYLVTPNAPVHLAAGNRPLERLIRMLQSRRLDVIVEDQSVFIYTAQVLGFNDYRQLGDIPGSEVNAELFIAFVPTDRGRRYARLLSDGVQQLRQSGELAKIMAKYGLRDWHRPDTALELN